MAIQLKVSNSLCSLAEALSDEVRNASDVFRPVTIVTQTEGMNNWLKIQLAEQLGIAANLQLLKPSDVIHVVFQLLGGKYDQSISKHELSWLLFKCLGEKRFIKKHPPIAAYYHYEGIDSDIKRMALAEKIADLFDQYQIYRAEEIDRWNNGLDWRSVEKNVQQWQKDLWLRVKELAGDTFPDKNSIGKFIMEALKDREKTAWLQYKLPVIYFFGLSLITEYHVRIIHVLSRYIDVRFLIQNPAPYAYWYEDKSEKVVDFLKRKNRLSGSDESVANPLLAGWGRLIRDTFRMLFENEDALNHYRETGVSEPPTDSLLHHIKNTIFNNQKEEIIFSEEQINDESVTINSCYSPIREVEALYNYLVHLVDKKNEKLSTRDIVVMVSDIDLYASYIKAVFGNAPYKLRYTIADESYADSDSLSNALTAVLSITEQQFTSEKVIGLLDFSALRRHFRINEMERIREWVGAANIRTGITGSRMDDSDYMSWEYGLKRIMYGLCMSGGEEYGTGENSFFPLDRIEGGEMFPAVRLVYFVRALIDSLKYRKQKRTITNWVKYVESVIQQFIGESEDNEEEEYGLLLHQLERYNMLEDVFTERVSYEVFLHHFLPALSETKHSSNFVSGGITFCSLVPMRSIPFKVVALLGMNFDQFPRHEKRVSFDLMQKHKQIGDRNVKENDKHLFLETLLSAGDYFYLSYIGQDLKDNSTLPPSALVDELLDFISSKTQNPEDTRTSLIRKHPLHGFSKAYNSNNPELYSYLIPQENNALNLLGKKEKTDLDFDEISIHQLVSFFKDPFKGYYNHVLKIYYEEDTRTLNETEIFQLDNLERWTVKNELLMMAEADMDAYRVKKVKLGELPLKNMSRVAVENIDADIEYARAGYLEYCAPFPEEKIELNVLLGGSIITGKIEGIYNDKLIRFSFSKDEQKYLLQGYLHYLAAAASGSEAVLKLVSNYTGTTRTGAVINRQEARERLADLVKLYKQGHESILPFHYRFGIKSKDLAKLNEMTFLKKITKKLENDSYASSNLYLEKEYQNGFFSQKSLFEEFLTVADLLLVPLDGFFENE